METLQDTLKVWDEQMLIEAVRMHANTNYSKGWDAVVEAFSDGDILEYLSNNAMNLRKTIKDIQAWIDLRKEMEDNARF